MILSANKLVIFAALPAMAGAWEETCTEFKNIYADGTELCEKMWAGSFEVVDSETDAYTMWFFNQETNPNDAVTTALFGADTVPDQCHLKYFHKDSPGPEGNDMTECHPWKKNACCDSTTVQSTDQLNNGYGEGYRWDRCGAMSEACERFFVMEACLYECEPSAGLYRKWDDSQKDHPEFNEWQLEKMPIQKNFCDSWYTACANDFFCGSGDYFECAAYYDENKVVAEEDDNKGLVIGLSIVGALAALGLIFSFYLVTREKQGKPVFSNAEAAVSS